MQTASMSDASSHTLRTTFIGAQLGTRIVDPAGQRGLVRSEVLPRALGKGLKCVHYGRSSTDLPGFGDPLMLKTVRIDRRIDDLLRVQPFDRRIPKNSALRGYLAAGLMP
jgi:hypothetical protein